jgi:hypothetical protein
MVKSVKLLFLNIIAVMFFMALFTSCEQEDNRIIYEIPKKDSAIILEKLKLLNLGKIVVFIDIDHSGWEGIDLCFQEVTDARMNEFYSKTNRYLKLSDTTFIPVYFHEDFVLAAPVSKSVLSSTGCTLKHRVEMGR